MTSAPRTSHGPHVGQTIRTLSNSIRRRLGRAVEAQATVDHVGRDLVNRALVVLCLFDENVDGERYRTVGLHGDYAGDPLPSSSSLRPSAALPAMCFVDARWKANVRRVTRTMNATFRVGGVADPNTPLRGRRRTL